MVAQLRGLDAAALRLVIDEPQESRSKKWEDMLVWLFDMGV